MRFTYSNEIQNTEKHIEIIATVVFAGCYDMTRENKQMRRTKNMMIFPLVGKSPKNVNKS